MKTRIRDGEMLARCLREAGYKVAMNASIRGYQGATAVDIAVRLPKGYDVGFVRSADGAYELVGDWWGVSGANREDLARDVGERVATVEEEIRRQAEELERKMRREYALEKSLRQLRQQGFQVTEQVTEGDGTVRLTARRWR